MVIDTLISGQVISEKAKRISQLLSVDSVLSSDMFVVSRHYPRTTQATILKEYGEEDPITELEHKLETDIRDLIVCLEDGYVEGESATYQYLINETKNVLDYIRYHYTRTVDYGSFRNQLLSGVSYDFDLGTMAYQEAWDYSKYGHTHDFTRVRLSAAYSSPSCLLSCRISNSAGAVGDTSFCMPEFVRPTQKIYKVGEMKFLAVDGRTVDVNSPSFDGWVFADGSTYAKSDFPEAYEAFKSAPGSTVDSFAVPVISGFVRPFPFRDQTTQFHAYQNHVTPHKHADIDNSQFKTYSKSTDVQIMIPIFYDGGGSTQPTAMHTGYSKYYGTMNNLSVEIESQDFTSYPAETVQMAQDTESKPRRNVFSVMVYIGKKAA